VPVAEGDELDLKLVEVGLHDPTSGVGKVDGYDVCVGGAAKLVGKKVRARVERALDGTAYATWLDGPGTGGFEPITAESEAEKPTRQPRSRKTVAEEIESAEAPADEKAAEPVDKVEAAVEADADGQAEEVDAVGDVEAAEPVPGDEVRPAPKKRTRRGSRGGRGRKKPAAPTEASADAEAVADAEEEPTEPVAEETTPESPAEEQAGPRIHIPADDLGREAEPAEEDAVGGEAKPAAPKRARRGSRGGRGRKRKTGVEAAADNGGEAVHEAEGVVEIEAAVTKPAAATAEAEAQVDGKPSEPEAATDWEYVPMSEWEDEAR
jgi:predicted RNA-binding protein with TRAM domain